MALVVSADDGVPVILDSSSAIQSVVTRSQKGLTEFVFKHTYPTPLLDLRINAIDLVLPISLITQRPTFEQALQLGTAPSHFLLVSLVVDATHSFRLLQNSKNQ